MKLASIVFFLSVMCLVTATHAGDLSDVLGRKGAKIENSSDGGNSQQSSGSVSISDLVSKIKDTFVGDEKRHAGIGGAVRDAVQDAVSAWKKEKKAGHADDSTPDQPQETPTEPQQPGGSHGDQPQQPQWPSDGQQPSDSDQHDHNEPQQPGGSQGGQPQQWPQWPQWPSDGGYGQQPSDSDQPSDDGEQPSTGSDGDAGSSASGSALELHNQYRQRHGGPALSWSSSIASQAQAYASRCVFEHSGTRGVGENLAMGHRSWAAVVQDWYSESAGFNYGSSSGTSGGGHFSQLVWKSTTQLGCGMASCGGRPLYVCLYSPPGNVRGRYAENVLPPTSG